MCFPGDVLGAPYGQISGSEGFRGSHLKSSHKNSQHSRARACWVLTAGQSLATIQHLNLGGVGLMS